MIPYEGGKVYGPYKREDERSHVIIWFSKTIKFTVSYPKYLMEIHLQRYLTDDEEVHHKDENVTNNQLDNFEIIDGSIHRSIHQTSISEEIWICAYCFKSFLPTKKQVYGRRSNIKRGKANTGPFCSRHCQGKINN